MDQKCTEMQICHDCLDYFKKDDFLLLKETKSILSAGKVMASIFRDARSKGHTEVYCGNRLPEVK
jgi:hypothetical protein